jgi:hypothetical protein
MRALCGLTAMAVLSAGAAVLSASPVAAVCSVFDRHPCAPTVCSVFQRRPCIPEIEYPIGQDLRLTIDSAATAEPNVLGARHETKDAEPGHELDSLGALFEALRACWVPPPREDARAGMQMTVRFSLKRSGEIIGTPRVTFTSPDAPSAVREAYHNAITAMLERCTPLPLSRGLGGAIAGRPIAIRFVDNRILQAGAP